MKQDASLKRHTLIVVTMASFLTPFMGSAVNLAIPSIGREFNSGAILLSWVVTSYILASVAFLVPLGRLADIVGRKKIFILGIISFSVCSLLCGLAWSIEVLIVFRLLQGVASAMIFSTGMAILTSVFQPHERGKALGINVATVYIGLALGPVLGGLISQYLGWQFIFHAIIPIGIIIVLLSTAKLKGEWAGAGGESYDFIGAVLYSVGLTSFIYGVSSLSNSSWAKYIMVFGMLTMLMFIKYQLQAKSPIINLNLFSKNVVFTFSNLAALINYSATAGIGFLLSLHLQILMELDTQIAGFILLSQPVIMALLSPLAGTLSDHVEPRIVASLGMALTTLGLLLFTFISLKTPIWFIIANLMLLGMGFALFSSPNSNAVMGSVEKRYYGIASSTLGTMRLTGQAISMSIVTLIIALFVGNVELSPVYADPLIKSMRVLFIIYTLICFGGIFASLARGNVNKLAPVNENASKQGTI